MMKLEIKSLSKSYGQKKALTEFNALLTQGVYGLLGPNGAGKSTLMNIITDNLAPDSGQVLYNGVNTLAMGKEFRRILGFMPQQQGLYDSFTARRFLFYMAALKGFNKKQAGEEVERAFSLVNLKDEANKKLGSYSGGMKQRILIAQAVMGAPKILILDEPTAGLDPKERIRIRNLISEISFNKIVIIATHVVQDIEYIAKEVMLLRNGELVAKDTPSALLSTVASKIFEITLSEEELAGISDKYRIGNITKDNGNVIVRILSESEPKESQYSKARPVLEDVYLDIFDI